MMSSGTRPRVQKDLSQSNQQRVLDMSTIAEVSVIMDDIRSNFPGPLVENATDLVKATSSFDEVFTSELQRVSGGRPIEYSILGSTDMELTEVLHLLPVGGLPQLDFLLSKDHIPASGSITPLLTANGVKTLSDDKDGKRSHNITILGSTDMELTEVLRLLPVGGQPQLDFLLSKDHIPASESITPLLTANGVNKIDRFYFGTEITNDEVFKNADHLLNENFQENADVCLPKENTNTTKQTLKDCVNPSVLPSPEKRVRSIVNRLYMEDLNTKESSPPAEVKPSKKLKPEKISKKGVTKSKTVKKKNGEKTDEAKNKTNSVKRKIDPKTVKPLNEACPKEGIAFTSIGFQNENIDVYDILDDSLPKVTPYRPKKTEELLKSNNCNNGSTENTIQTKKDSSELALPDCPETCDVENSRGNKKLTNSKKPLFEVNDADLNPAVQMDKGKYATSDANKLKKTSAKTIKTNKKEKNTKSKATAASSGSKDGAALDHESLKFGDCEKENKKVDSDDFSDFCYDNKKQKTSKNSHEKKLQPSKDPLKCRNSDENKHVNVRTKSSSSQAFSIDIGTVGNMSPVVALENLLSPLKDAMGSNYLSNSFQLKSNNVLQIAHLDKPVEVKLPDTTEKLLVNVTPSKRSTSSRRQTNMKPLKSFSKSYTTMDFSNQVERIHKSQMIRREHIADLILKKYGKRDKTPIVDIRFMDSDKTKCFDTLLEKRICIESTEKVKREIEEIMKVITQRRNLAKPDYLHDPEAKRKATNGSTHKSSSKSLAPTSVVIKKPKETGANNYAHRFDEGRKCFSCGTVSTPRWRKYVTSHDVCNACGLYYNRHNKNRRLSALRKTAIPKRKKVDKAASETTTRMIDSPSTGANNYAHRFDEGRKCFSCGTVSTPRWRKYVTSHDVCNACGLYYNRHNAVNKLAKIMNRKDLCGKKNKSIATDLRKKEKECRKLQQELTVEKEKYNQMVARFQKELDSKDSEIEQLQQKLALVNSETASVNSGPDNEMDDGFPEIRLEGWLSIPNKQNIRRHGWKKSYVVVSNGKIIFYNNELDKANADPVIILNLNKLFHVRSVTQGDVIRAYAKDIPRIFQLLYAGEGESRKPGDCLTYPELQLSKDLTQSGTLEHKGHDFVFINFHMPTNCEVCPRPMWRMFRPPPALECRRCGVKVHKDHLERKEELIAPCKVNYDPNSAKELLLLANSIEEQQMWVSRLRKKIEKCGYAAQQETRGGSPRASMRSTNKYQPQKSATLPTGVLSSATRK